MLGERARGANGSDGQWLNGGYDGKGYDGIREVREARRRVLLLRFIWFLTIMYGESIAFWWAIRRCKWENWENWPAQSDPYRIVLIADPQLVDNNTYSRRGIFMALTKYFTDLYMRRNWLLLNRILNPNSDIFLGDMMDGGREWDNDEYFKEYLRFHRIFSQPSTDTRVIMSLPGNHDFGFGDTIINTAWDRFQKYFGESSSVHELGNHTIVLLDTVTLSNADNHTQTRQSDLILERLSLELANHRNNMLPRILISHEPLYRPEGTDCGPLRERPGWLLYLRGPQFQNMLIPPLSERILQSLEPIAIFSGDDHDYCEVQHIFSASPTLSSLQMVPKQNITERTVKSFSFAMGISYPAVQLVSLNNPALGYTGRSDTYQTKMCYLQNQYAIYSLYLALILITLALTILRNTSIRNFNGIGSSMYSSAYDSELSNTKSPKHTTLPLHRIDPINDSRIKNALKNLKHKLRLNQCSFAWRNIYSEVFSVAWPVIIVYIYMSRW